MPWTGLTRVPLRSAIFGSAAAAASGVVEGYRATGRDDVTVVVIAGDGGTHDIGLQSLSGAAERGDSFVWICQNNEAYMNTGGQRSGATPKWARTTNTPVGSVIKGKPQWGKDMIAIMEAHEIPYIAQASVSHMKDFKRKIMKAQQITGREKRGLSYIEVLNTCPTGWGYPEDQMIQVARLAVQTCYWPLFEIEEGTFTLNHRPKELKPLREYLEIQGRFRHLTNEQINQVEERVKKKWERLLKRADEG